MSAGRAFRRQAGRWQWRQPGIEPSAATRAWVGRMLAAHDDDEVSVDEFRELAQRFAAYMADRPEAERVEAAGQILDRSLENILGEPVRAIGMGTWPP